MFGPSIVIIAKGLLNRVRPFQTAFAMTTFNTFWIYLTPLLGAFVADQYLGRYKTVQCKRKAPRIAPNHMLMNLD